MLDLDTRWSLVVSFNLRSLNPEEEANWYLLDRRFCATHIRAGPSGKEKTFLRVPRIEPRFLSCPTLVH
jgi:hypothetical protein